MKRFLVIQTAFLGDAVLATSILEKLHDFYPDAEIDLVVRKGNEGLFGASTTGADRAVIPPPHSHPFLRNVFVWNKGQNKNRNLFALIVALRKTEYDHIINCQRFFSTGLMTVLSRGKEKVGYDKNPLSLLFTRSIKHEIPSGQSKESGHGVHEVDRLNALIAHLTDGSRPLPRLYPTEMARDEVKVIRDSWAYGHAPYISIAPASVWSTKQWPEGKWVGLVKAVSETHHVYLIGSPGDVPLCERIMRSAQRGQVVAKDLSLLGSAALMQGAAMNYVNDSAPLHIASAMNAPVTVVFCSTVPSFGFGPLRENGRVVETTEKLDCRPCGLHGHRECPQGHFRCALGIEVRQLTEAGFPPQ